MEMVGNDNRIRALFCEVKAADLQRTPDFSTLWHHAESGSAEPQWHFSFSLAVVTALLALTLGSFAVWSIYLDRSQAHYQVFAELKATDKPVTPEITSAGGQTTPRTDQKPLRRPVRSRVNKSSTQNESLIAKNAKANTIDSWQSPTAALLTSPADGLFKSLPQLNENANELKSFLPGRTNEKEK